MFCMQAVLTATKSSLGALQWRLVSAGVPLFHVAVQLTVPSVGLEPSLQGLQSDLDSTAKQVRHPCFSALIHRKTDWRFCLEARIFRLAG